MSNDDISISDAFKTLTVDDYVAVLPKSQRIKYGAGGQVQTNCINPDHIDTNASMFIKQGNTQVVFNCFGCKRYSLVNIFTKLLIQHNRLSLEKIATKSLRLFVKLGYINQGTFERICGDRDDYQKVISKNYFKQNSLVQQFLKGGSHG
tara:strand:+ start:3222 stop:3668 length:447 start_codon:yes stop_codon:yes gene_type:complete